MDHLLNVLKESYEGASSPGYLDTDSGLRSTLSKLSAEAASRGDGRTSIAAHAHHVLFGLEAFAAALRGDKTPRDWNESWSVSGVDDARWKKLQDDLGTQYASFSDAVKNAKDDQALNTAAAGIAHVVYHLGAIRARL